MPLFLVKFLTWLGAFFKIKTAVEQTQQKKKETDAVKKAQETGDTSDLENL